MQPMPTRPPQTQPDPTPVVSVSPALTPASTRPAPLESPRPSPVPTRATPGAAGAAEFPGEAGPFTADEALRTYGSIAFNAPSTTQLGKSHMIQLLLDPSGIPPEILGEAISEPGEVRTATIRISDSVEAKLTGAAFEIRAITPEIQAVSGIEATEWRWEIVPKEQGMHRLFLTINALVPSAAGERRRSIRTFDQTIRVEVTATPLERFGIPAAIVLVIAGLALIVVLDRRSRLVAKSAPADSSIRPDDAETVEMEGTATVAGTAADGRFIRRELSEGEVVAGRYVVGPFLGKGGMGAVYAAEDRELGERVALKTMLPAMMGERSLQRFRREIQYARRVAHPNVCRIHDLGQHRPADGGEPLLFVSMELVQGRTLSALIRERGRFTEADALPIIEQIAAGLEATHRAGLVHRDIKPANIMVTDEPMRVVVMDFGLARLSDPIAREGSITETGALVGSPVYMAPEQLEDAEVSPATDIYAFGAVIYEMVTGGRPFEGENPVSLIAQRLHGQPIPPSRRTPGISSTWEKAILRCLERNPADRFQSVRELVEELRALPT